MCYVHVPDSHRRKLHQKASRAIFVGYPQGTKGYKLYDLEKKNFVISRSNIFREEISSVRGTVQVEQCKAARELTTTYLRFQVKKITIQWEKMVREKTNNKFLKTRMSNRVGENERLRNSRTYEDLFMENV
jgi:hypothetical protein